MRPPVSKTPSTVQQKQPDAQPSQPGREADKQKKQDNRFCQDGAHIGCLYCFFPDTHHLDHLLCIYLSAYVLLLWSVANHQPISGVRVNLQLITHVSESRMPRKALRTAIYTDDDDQPGNE